MSRVQKALWQRRLKYRQRKLASVRKGAHRSGTVTHAEADHIHKWEKLVAEAERALARSLTPRDKSVNRAKHWIGTVEHPYGSNGGGQIDVWQRHFGFGHVAWCGLFAGNMLSWAGVKGLTSRIAAVSLIEDDARARRGPFTGWNSGGNTRGVQRGDLVVLFGRGVHVEIVDRFGPGAVYTVGGNTSSGNSGSQSNGGGVFPRERSLRDVHGFAKVRYP